MNLHRADKRPQWLRRPARNYNFWQGVAAATNSWVTPANLLTVLGFLIVIAGLVAFLNGRNGLGLACIIIGRFCDLADGWVAEYTKTKSPLGESLDAGFDKVATILMLVTLFITHLVPWLVLIALFIPHILIAGVAGRALLRGRRLHPSRAGKLSMACAWVGLGGVISIAVFNGVLAFIFGILGYGLLAASLVLGIIGFIRYIQASNTKA